MDKFDGPHMYSVDQVAAQLGLHVRTVRNYVRSGRLKAVRIGKQYRIAREHLEALTGRSMPATAATVDTPQSRADVSTIVDLDGLDEERASRLTTGLMAAVKGRPKDDEPLRVDTI